MEKLSNQISIFQVSEINVSYRPKFKASERPTVCNSKEVYNVFYQNWDVNKIELLEQFKIMLLNRANRVLGIYEVSSGGMSGTIADPKLIFSTALITCSSAIMLAHNHPSGNAKPSSHDIELTKKIKMGGKLLDIEVLDHLIITNESYFSFADEGLI